MNGIALYFILATTAAGAIFLFAEWTREPGLPAPDHPGCVALIAGLLWPLVLVGLAQYALVVAAGNRWGGGPAPAMRIRVGAKAKSR